MATYSIFDITSNEHKGNYNADTAKEALQLMRDSSSKYETDTIYVVTTEYGFAMLVQAISENSIMVLHSSTQEVNNGGIEISQCGESNRKGGTESEG